MKMRKILLFILFGVFCLALPVFALNLEFTIGVPDKIFYPNETIPVNISIINREMSFSARNVTLGVYIGERSFLYELNDIKASNSILEEITLPEFPPGNYVIKGQLNYTDFFDERETLETYNSFHVRFPEMERLPRNIIIKSFSIPKNITTGNSYPISIIVSNEGNITGNLIVAVESLGVNESKQIRLEPKESDTVTIDIIFYNSGISNVEARVYAIVNDVKYLLSFDTKTIFVKESKIANLLFNNIELVDEPDNKINQDDIVKLKISLLNKGTWLASNVKGELSSSLPEIETIQSKGNFGIIPKNAFSNSIFEIKTSNAKVGSAKLMLTVSYMDGLGDHSTTFEIPITITEGSEACKADSDCLENQMCSNNRCVAVPCECGEVINHQCKQYACCNNLDCEEGYVCSFEKHICEPSQEIKADVLIVTSNKLKVTNDFTKALREYRNAILEEDLSSFYISVDSQRVQELFNIQPADPNDWRSVKNVLDKIIYKVKPNYLLILGGVDIIPQPPAKTDAEIPIKPVSDDRYVDLNLDGVPDIAVGRIPIDNVEFLIEYLNMLIDFHKEPIINEKIILGDGCGGKGCFLYKDIEYTSNFIFGVACKQNSNCLISPPYCYSKGSPPIFPIPCEKRNEMKTSIEKSDLIFFAAHGDGTSFVAIEDGIGLIGDLILSGNQIYEMDFSKKTIMTFACFGGSIDVSVICLIGDTCVYNKLKPSKSTALASIYRKTPIYIGNTRFGYGTISAQFFKEIYDKIKEGESVGNSILKMKQQKLKRAWSDWYKAVIYEIQLYGDPTIKLIGV